MVKNLSANAGGIRDASSIPGSGRLPGGGHGNPLQYSCLTIPWAEENGGLQSIGLQRVGHDCCDLTHMHGHSSCVGKDAEVQRGHAPCPRSHG